MSLEGEAAFQAVWTCLTDGLKLESWKALLSHMEEHGHMKYDIKAKETNT